MVADTKSQTLFATLKTKVLPDSIVYTDSYRSYNILDISDIKHFRMNHSLISLVHGESTEKYFKIGK